MRRALAPISRTDALPRGVAIFFLSALACLLSADALAATRRALIVANSTYNHAPQLPNPPNDAALIKQRLESVGFVVEPYSDVTAKQFPGILENFVAQLDNETVAPFYYAGHGIQYKGENFLVGVDANLRSESSLELEAFPFSKIISRLEKRAGTTLLSGTTLLFWDACRKNPLAHGQLLSGAATLPSRSENTLIMFSAEPGQDAMDGNGPNSPFAEALARRIATPNVDVEAALKTVSVDVWKSTDRAQRPDRQLTQLVELFYLNAQGAEVLEAVRKTEEIKVKVNALPPAEKKRVIIKGNDDVPIPGQFSSNLPSPSRGFPFEPLVLDVNLSKATIIRRIRVSPDGKIFALGGDDGVVRFVSLETFAVIGMIKAHNGRISDLDFTPDGRVLLSTGRDGAARLWEVKTGAPVGEPLKVQHTELYSGRINSSFPDRYLIFGDGKGYLYTKDLKRNQLITDAKFHTGAIRALSYQPNGKGAFFSAGADGILKIRLPEGQRMVVKADHDAIFQADYDQTGSLIYTAGKDRKIKIWNARNLSSQKPERVLEGHLKYVLTANSSRTENMLVSGGGDKAVNVWSLNSGALMAHLVGHKNDVEAVTFTPNNRFVISASEDGSVRIWSLDNRESLVRMYFQAGGAQFAGVTFDNRRFGDRDAELITVRVDGKAVSSLDEMRYDNYIGRGISIYEY